MGRVIKADNNIHRNSISDINSINDLNTMPRSTGKVNSKKTLMNYQKGHEIRDIKTNEAIHTLKDNRGPTLDHLDANSVIELPHQVESVPRQYPRANSDNNEPNLDQRQGLDPFDLAIDPVKQQKEKKSILKKNQGYSEKPTIEFRGSGGQDQNKNSVPLPLKKIEEDEPQEDSDFGGEDRIMETN